MIRFKQHIGALAALLLALACNLPAATAAEEPVPEETLKAVLFYKLPFFVYHGDHHPGMSTHFCTLGTTMLDAMLEVLAQRPSTSTNAGLSTLATIDAIDDCDYLFIGRSEAGQLDEILASIQARHIVTVSDIEGFARAGGMVEFALQPDASGLRILINIKAARMNDVQFNAQLLRLAEVIDD